MSSLDKLGVLASWLGVFGIWCCGLCCTSGYGQENTSIRDGNPDLVLLDASQFVAPFPVAAGSAPIQQRTKQEGDNVPKTVPVLQDTQALRSDVKVGCVVCGGKGWIEGFQGTERHGRANGAFCQDCGKEVSTWHSHDKCPGCSGKKL